MISLQESPVGEHLDLILSGRSFLSQLDESFLRLALRLYLDHRRRLHIRQFLDATLTRDDVANLQRQIRVFLFLTDL